MTRWKHNHCELSQKAIEWINGELLGDGSLRSRSHCSAQFTYGTKHLEYIRYISKILNSFGIKQGGRINKHLSKFGCYSYHYRSLSYAELLPLHKEWYPEGKKVVPKNLKLTPLTCRQWYIGDGTLQGLKKTKPDIRLASQGFTVYDVEWLVDQMVNLGFRVTKTDNNKIHISVYSTEEFLEYIGSCPVECYKYKWNYWRGKVHD